MRSADQAHIVPFRKNYFIYIYRQISGLGEKPWIIGATLGGSKAGQEAERLQSVVMIGIGLLLASVLGAVFVGRRLARPMRDLVLLRKRCARSSSGTLPCSSRVRELDTAGQSLNAMVTALRWLDSICRSASFIA